VIDIFFAIFQIFIVSGMTRRRIQEKETEGVVKANLTIPLLFPSVALTLYASHTHRSEESCPCIFPFLPFGCLAQRNRVKKGGEVGFPPLEILPEVLGTHGQGYPSQ